MKDRPLFSVREAMSGEGTPDEIFQRCLLDAKRFIHAHSVPDILHYVFEGEKNRKTVTESVHDFLHVGFLFPHERPVDMEGLSKQSGFSSGSYTVTSAVVARELGYLEGCADVPTSIFTAKLGGPGEDSGYVEVFLPDIQAARARRWMEDEVGTHIGLILKDPSAFEDIRAAFHHERFRIAPFMKGKRIYSPGKSASVIYYEQPCITGKSRIEIFCPGSLSDR